MPRIVFRSGGQLAVGGVGFSRSAEPLVALRGRIDRLGWSGLAGGLDNLLILPGFEHPPNLGRILSDRQRR